MGRAARKMDDVMSLGCWTVTVIDPRWGLHSKDIILDMQLKIPNAEISNVRHFEGHV